MSVTHAIKKLFRRRASFVIVGLTGRTGSGCTTSARLLSLPFHELLLNPVASPLTSPEERKFRIIRDFAQKNWEPFTVISVTQTIASFLFSGDENETATFLRTLIPSSAATTFLAEVERVRPIWRSVSHVLQNATLANATEKEIDAFFDFWDNELTAFLRVARLALGNGFSHAFQTMGDNLRSSGKIFSPKIETDEFYVLPERVGQVIVAARAMLHKRGRPACIAIDALRNPFEIQYFRERFASFYLVAVTTADKDRKSRLVLKNLTNTEIKKLDNKEYPSENKPLAGYAQLVSQNIQACIEKADIFLHNSGEAVEGRKEDLKALAQQLLTFVCLMQHPGLITPSKVERCMQIAYSAKVNSGCISRQVGAAVTDGSYSVKGVGWNDVPAGQISCLLRRAQDLVEGDDESAFSDYELQDEKFKAKINGRYKKFSLVDAVGRSSAFCFKSEFNSLDARNKGNQVHTRSLHAEENAFLQISKYGGPGLDGGILFSTASPCELCSKKAFQLGIKKIYYIDPYPGISLNHILSSGPKNLRPEVILFQGAVGQAFHRLYDPILPFKDEMDAFISPAIEPLDETTKDRDAVDPDLIAAQLDLPD